MKVVKRTFLNEQRMKMAPVDSWNNFLLEVCPRLPLPRLTSVGRRWLSKGHERMLVSDEASLYYYLMLFCSQSLSELFSSLMTS